VVRADPDKRIQLDSHERPWVIDPLGTPRNYASYKFVRLYKPSNKAVAQPHSRSSLQLAEIVVARYVVQCACAATF
jgi:hypothetical protein